MRYALTPIDRPPRAFPVAAFDVEGDAERFVVGAFADEDGKIRVFRDPASLTAALRQAKARRVFAHNALYDIGVLIHHLDQAEILLKSGRLLKVRFLTPRDAPLILDSFWFWPMALDRVGKVVGLEKLGVEFGKDNERISWDELIARYGMEAIETYCARDAEIVQRAMMLFQEELNRLGGELKPTLAGTAMDLFRRRFLEKPVPLLPPEVDRFIRQAYYGGRTENFVVGKVRNIRVYDINSMYPYVMLKYPYPDPQSWRIVEGVTDIRLIQEFEGVSEADVIIPDMEFPPLPIRYEGKTVFPVGRLHGVWTHAELREAVARGGKVVRMHRTVFFEEVCRPFASYVQTLYELRLSYKRAGDPRELVVKLLMNSLYGKFGEDYARSDVKRIVPYERATELAGKNYTVEIVELGGAEWGLAEEKRRARPRHTIPIWAAYVTAWARLELLKRMEECGDVVYCDTDSLFTHREMPTGDGLGELKLEGEYEEGIIQNPKVYLLKSETGKPKTASRGIPIALAETFIHLGEVTFLKAVKLLEAIRRGLAPSSWIEVKKVSRTTFPKRQPLPGSVATVRTRPWRLRLW